MRPIDSVHMQTALLHASLSKAVRKKVGAVLVTKQGVVLTGYNGTPSGYTNQCENSVYSVATDEWTTVSRPEVIHAELNTILKAAREGVSVLYSTIYVTLSPCIACSAMLTQAGVKKVIYLEEYRDNSGILLLKDCNVEVLKFN